MSYRSDSYGTPGFHTRSNFYKEFDYYVKNRHSIIERERDAKSEEMKEAIRKRMME